MWTRRRPGWEWGAGADGYLFYTAVSLDIMSLYISCVHAFTVTDKTESFESFAGIMASTTVRCKIYGPPPTPIGPQAGFSVEAIFARLFKSVCVYGVSYRRCVNTHTHLCTVIRRP